MQLLPGAEPFRLDAGPSKVLLLHGFASTPFEMRYLGEKLQQAGFSSVCPLLPGHGTDLAFFARTTWQDWLRTARETLARLFAESEGRPVAIAGQSLGALLALALGALHPAEVAALACLATPLQFAPLSTLAVQAYRFTPLRLLELTVPRAGGADIEEPRLRRGLPGYERIPLRAAASFRELQQRVIDLLPRLDQPLLVLHGALDSTAPPAGAEELLRRAGSRVQRLELLPDSRHVISLDVDRGRVAQSVVEFFGAHAPPPTPQAPAGPDPDPRSAAHG